MNNFLIILSLVSLSLSSNQIWTPEVTIYSKNNGYAGVFGKPISSIRVSGNQEYRVRNLNGGWFPSATGNNMYDHKNGYAGMEGISIDGVAIKGAKYRVHILGEGWLEEVDDYDLKNPNCGISGKPIDAIMVKERTYAVAYTLSITNIINYGNEEVSQSSIVNCAKNQIGKSYVEGAEGPDNFDASGLAYFCHGKKIPRDIKEQEKNGVYIINPQPGDLLFFRPKDDKSPPIVSICIINEVMIYAPNSDTIQYAFNNEGDWSNLYIGARRYWNL